MINHIELLQRRLDRERRARKEAETLLEIKSLELYMANQRLLNAQQKLEERVHQRTEQLASSNQRLSEEILERQKAEEALGLARDEALEASRLKSEFLANMSHEIRTPLNAIIGLTNLLLESDFPPQQRDFLETIFSSGNSLLAIINDILDFSRIEANKLELDMQPFIVRECIEDTLDLLAQNAHAKGLELIYTMESPMPELFIGDVTRLRQILVNLLGNGVKFTKKGEVVLRLSATHQEDGRYLLHFAVSDSGIGIPESGLPHLFDAFSQVDASNSRQFGGTGLGLAICKRLCELMGGEIWVESTKGEGSTFHFTLPAEAIGADQERPLQKPQADLSNTPVLLIEPNDTSRSILKEELTTWGMCVTAVATATEAIGQLQTSAPYALILFAPRPDDIDQPSYNSLLHHAEIAQTPIIPLMPLSTNPSFGDISSFTPPLKKPVQRNQLRRALLRIISKHQNPNTPIISEPERSTFSQLHPLRILLVEDNPVNQKVAFHLFHRFGYRPDMVSNGQEGIDALRRQPYDVIFMDIQMPVMDGMEAVRRIVEEWGEKRPYLVAMTANAMDGDKERYLKSGFDDYVSKPIKLESLSASLRRCTLQSEKVAL